MRFFSLPHSRAMIFSSSASRITLSSNHTPAPLLLVAPSSSSHQQQASRHGGGGYSLGYHQRQAVAFYWMDVVRFKIDKKTGKRVHEDPEDVVKRHQEQRRSDGQSLLDLHIWNDRHEKKWMRRKRLEQKRRYEFDKKHVNDLAKYIAFVQKK
jgi:hypothetical protein